MTSTRITMFCYKMGEYLHNFLYEQFFKSKCNSEDKLLMGRPTTINPMHTLKLLSWSQLIAVFTCSTTSLGSRCTTLFKILGINSTQRSPHCGKNQPFSVVWLDFSVYIPVGFQSSNPMFTFICGLFNKTKYDSKTRKHFFKWHKTVFGMLF